MTKAFIFLFMITHLSEFANSSLSYREPDKVEAVSLGKLTPRGLTESLLRRLDNYTLDLSNSVIDAEDMRAVAQHDLTYSAVLVLNLSSTILANDSFIALGSLKLLGKLVLTSSSINNDQIKYLAKLEGLELLNLSGCLNLTTGVTKVLRDCLGSSKLTGFKLEKLSPHCVLDLQYLCVTDAYFQQLHHLSISYSTVNRESLRIWQCPKLASLHMRKVNLIEEPADWRVDLPQTKVTSFTSSKNIVEGKSPESGEFKDLKLTLFEDYASAPLSKSYLPGEQLVRFIHLAQLDLSSLGLKDTDLKHLPLLAALERLYIHDNHLTNAAFRYIRNPKLIVLDIGRNNLTDLPPINSAKKGSRKTLGEDYTVFSSGLLPPNLCVLDLSRNNIKGNCLPGLLKYTKITTLYLIKSLSQAFYQNFTFANKIMTIYVDNDRLKAMPTNKYIAFKGI